MKNTTKRTIKKKSVASPKTKRSKTRMVTFKCHAPKAKQVSLAGTFNDWDTSVKLMKRQKDGNWKVSLRLAPGSYEYKFFVDGEWYTEPEKDSSDGHNHSCVSNPFGTLNHQIQVVT